MPPFTLKKPRLPGHFYVRVEPPDDAGEEALIFTSERRQIKIKGHSFREFHREVLPLLDGRHTLEEIQVAAADIFAPEDLEQCLVYLAQNSILQEADADTLPVGVAQRLEPQLNLFHELGLNAHQAQAQLAAATVTLLGMGSVGASTALALAGAQVGTLRCVDALSVTHADTSLAPLFLPEDVGKPRAEVMRRKIAAMDVPVAVTSVTQPLQTDAEVTAAVAGSDFVICSADAGQMGLVYKLNRACLKLRLPWTSCAVSGLEGVVGPTVYPGETPCYLCYRMRAVACTTNAEAELSYLHFLDRRKRDDSGVRENHPFAVGVIANLMALEAMKALIEGLQPSARGRILVIDFLNVTNKQHLILRKPRCPACFAPDKEAVAD
ncbi:MAG: UBA/THIF-type binding protein [Chthonomonadaceae bacterium]|nr:UBA/THIF-type binding protein [Chthonomonadaceae bacterium]